MTEQKTESAGSEEKSSRLPGRFYLVIFISSGVSTILNKSSVLPVIVAYVLGYFIGGLVFYWVPPRPSVRFSVWFVRLTGLFALALVGLWAIPILLGRWMWPPLAYGSMAFLTFLLLFFIPPIRAAQKRKIALWQWVIFCTVFGLLFGVLGHFA